MDVVESATNLEMNISCSRTASSILNDAVEETALMETNSVISPKISRRRLTHDEICRLKNREIDLHDIFPSGLIDICIVNCLLSKHIAVPVEFLGISKESWNNLKSWIKDLKSLFYGCCLFALWREMRHTMHAFQRDRFEFSIFRQWLCLYDRELHDFLISKEKILHWRKRFANFMNACGISGSSNVWVFGEISLLISGKQINIPENDILMYKHFKEGSNIPLIGKPHVHTFISVSALGHATKPCVIYPREILFSNLSTPLKNTSYIVESTHGDVNLSIVLSWLNDVFVPMSHCSATNPAILLINENFSGLGLLTWNFCNTNGIKIFCYPRSCDSPFNKGIFDLFNKYWKETQKLYSTTASENVATQRSVLFMYKQSLRNALHIRKIPEVLSDYAGLNLDLSSIDGPNALKTEDENLDFSKARSNMKVSAYSRLVSKEAFYLFFNHHHVEFQLIESSFSITVNRVLPVSLKRRAEMLLVDGPPNKISRRNSRIAIIESFLKKEIPVRIAESKLGLKLNFIRRCKVMKKHSHLTPAMIEKLIVMFNDSKTYDWVLDLASKGCSCIDYVFLYDLCLSFGLHGVKKSFYRDYIAKSQFWLEFLELHPQSKALFDDEGNLKSRTDTNTIYSQVLNQNKYDSSDQIWFVDAFEFPVTSDDRAIGLPTKNAIRPRHSCKKVSVIFAFSFGGLIFKPVFIFPSLFDPIENDETHDHFISVNGFLDPLAFKYFLHKFNSYCALEKFPSNRLLILSSSLPVINIECLNICKITNVELVFAAAGGQPSPFERFFSCANRGRSSDLFIECWKRLVTTELKSHLIKEFSRHRFANLFDSAIKETLAELGDIKKKAMSAFLESSFRLYDCASPCNSSETIGYAILSTDEEKEKLSQTKINDSSTDLRNNSNSEEKNDSISAKCMSTPRTHLNVKKPVMVNSLSQNHTTKKFIMRLRHRSSNKKSSYFNSDANRTPSPKDGLFRRIANDYRVLESRRRSLRIQNVTEKQTKSPSTSELQTSRHLKKSDDDSATPFQELSAKKHNDVESISLIERCVQAIVEQRSTEVQTSFDLFRHDNSCERPGYSISPNHSAIDLSKNDKSMEQFTMTFPDDTKFCFGDSFVLAKNIKTAYLSAQSFTEATINLLNVVFSDTEQASSCQGVDSNVRLDARKLQWIRSVVLHECRFMKDHDMIWNLCELAVNDHITKKFRRRIPKSSDDKKLRDDKLSKTEVAITNKIPSSEAMSPYINKCKADEKNQDLTRNDSSELTTENCSSAIQQTEKSSKLMNVSSNRLLSAFSLVLEPPHPLPDMSVPIVSISDNNQSLTLPDSLIASIPFAAANFAAHIFNADECSTLDPKSHMQSIDLLKLDKVKLKLVKDSILAKCPQSVNTESLWNACCSEIHKRLTESYMITKPSLVQKSENDDGHDADDDVIWIGGGRSNVDSLVKDQSNKCSNSVNVSELLETDYLQQIIFGNYRQREVANTSFLNPSTKNANVYMSLTHNAVSRSHWLNRTPHQSFHSLLSINSPRFPMSPVSSKNLTRNQPSSGSILANDSNTYEKCNMNRAKTTKSYELHIKQVRMYCFDGLEITESQIHLLAQRSSSVQQLALYLFTVIFKVEEIPPSRADSIRKLDPLKIEWIRSQCQLQGPVWESCLNSVLESRSKWYEIRSLAISIIEDLPSSDIIISLHKRFPDYISFILSLADMVFYKDWHVQHYVGSSLRRLAYMKSTLFSYYRVENQLDAWKNCTKAVCNWAIQSNRFVPPLDQEIQQFFKGNQNLQEVTIMLAQFITSPPRFTEVLDTLKTEWIKSFIMCSASSNVDRNVIWKSCEAILKKHCEGLKSVRAPTSQAVSNDSREVIFLHSSQT